MQTFKIKLTYCVSLTAVTDLPKKTQGPYAVNMGILELMFLTRIVYLKLLELPNLHNLTTTSG